MITNMTLLDFKYQVLTSRLEDLYVDKVLSLEDFELLMERKYLTNILITPIDPFTDLPNDCYDEALQLYKLDWADPYDFSKTVMMDLVVNYIKEFFDMYHVSKDGECECLYLSAKHNARLQVKLEGGDLDSILNKLLGE